jgi:membrane protease YdiL (CAAX protease family)
MGSQADTRRLRPWLFFALTIVWSWTFLLPAVAAGLTADTLPVPVLRALAGIGPLVAALVLVYLTLDRSGRRDYWRRLLSPARIGARWFAAIFLIPPVLTALAAAVDLLLGGYGLHLEGAARLLEQPLTIVPYVLFILVFGPLPEEMGWRGYALDGLQARRSALTASLVLGAAWAVWHLPLFLISGTYQAGLGVGTAAFWLFMVAIIPQSVVITWIYNNTRRSTLSAVLFHFVVNLTGELFALSPRADALLVALWLALAVGVVAIWGPARLSRQAALATADQR